MWKLFVLVAALFLVLATATVHADANVAAAASEQSWAAKARAAASQRDLERCQEDAVHFSGIVLAALEKQIAANGTAASVYHATYAADSVDCWAHRGRRLELLVDKLCREPVALQVNCDPGATFDAAENQRDASGHIVKLFSLFVAVPDPRLPMPAEAVRCACPPTARTPEATTPAAPLTLSKPHE